MAQKKQQGSTGAAIGHAAIGTVPIGATYEGYKGVKSLGGGTGAAVGGAVGGTVVPFFGTTMGAIHGAKGSPRRSSHGGRTKV